MVTTKRWTFLTLLLPLVPVLLVLVLPLPLLPRGNELSTKSNHRPPANAGSRRKMSNVRHYLLATLYLPNKREHDRRER